MAKLINPSRWVSWKPFGIGEQHPNNFAEITRAIRENRDQAGYAWRILSQGVCDGCALGVAGLHDWTLSGPHLCNIRLRLLRLNTIGPLDGSLLADVRTLQGKSSAELRTLGRLPYPMVRRRGDRGFRRIDWDEALDLIAGQIRATTPDRTAWYLTSRGIPNETYYVAQKAVRAMGTNNVDNAARICHSPSTVALKATVGIGATSCSYSDWIGSDLIVFIGANPANNQPVTTKYMHHALAEGTTMVSVNTMVEPAMERYWIPSIPESALFGTRLVDETYLVQTGGDAAFLNGVLKHVIERDLVDQTWIEAHTTGFAELTDHLRATSWDDLEAASGSTTDRMRSLGERIGNARTAVFVWSMGVTQHRAGEETVRTIVNLALSRGFVGRDKCGLMPIRGHSGVQGGAEMGAYATVFPGSAPINAETAAALGKQWGFDVPDKPGLTAPEMIDAASRGDLDVLVAMGGNFLEAMPDPEQVEAALANMPLRVHIDIVLSSQMLADPGETVVLLPATTRYEIAGGVTQTSTERRIMFSPEIRGPRIAGARSEWEIFRDLAARVRPDRKDRLAWTSTQQIRDEIATIVPAYDGIQHLRKTGDQVQYGGPHLAPGGHFPTASGRGSFSMVDARSAAIPVGQFALSTRRGKQFNTMVHETHDSITGTQSRDAVFMHRKDAAALGLRDGDRIVISNEFGSMAGRIFLARMQPRTVQVYWPEGNVLIDPAGRSPLSHVPDYNALVTIQRATESQAAD
jgi:molybdopterin-dependent oxidoreductase alpha subunit